MAWLLLVAALAVGGVAVVARARHPAPAGAASAEAAPGPVPQAGSVSPRGPVSLPGSISLAAIPAPLPGETATGADSTGALSVTDAPSGPSATPAAAPPGPGGVPGIPFAAYRHAEQVLAVAEPGCQLHWPVLAAIGRAESGHAQGGRVDATGRTLGRLLGPRLDGSAGLPRVPDTDRGELDGDPMWDRAVGPLQLLPSVWHRYGADGDGDGQTDPNDVYDAALTAARYLCAGGVDLADPRQLDAALLRYRHSTRYVSMVRQWAGSPTVSAAPAPGVPAPAAGTAPKATGPPPSARRAPAVPRPVAVGSAPGARPPPRAVSKPPTAGVAQPAAQPPIAPEPAAGAQPPIAPEPAAGAQPAAAPEPAAGTQPPVAPEQAPTLPAAPQPGDAPDQTGYVIVIPEPAASDEAPTAAGGNQPRAGDTDGTHDDTEAGGADQVDGDTGGSPSASAGTGSSSVPWPTTAR